MFQLELVGKPVIKWLVIRVIETLHINGAAAHFPLMATSSPESLPDALL